MGVDTLFVPLSVILSELYLNIHFSVMAALICIKIVLGTFFQLVNIANRFYGFFPSWMHRLKVYFRGCTGTLIFD